MANNVRMTGEQVDIAISLYASGFTLATISRCQKIPIATLHRTLRKLPLSLQTPKRLMALLKAPQGDGHFCLGF
jgi:hypothetical protein